MNKFIENNFSKIFARMVVDNFCFAFCIQGNARFFFRCIMHVSGYNFLIFPQHLIHEKALRVLKISVSSNMNTFASKYSDSIYIIYVNESRALS